MATNKNTMLPTFQGTYAQVMKALEIGKIDAPGWAYLTDINALAFIHYEDVQGEKKLIPRIIMLDRIISLENKIGDLGDDTVKEYVDEAKTETIEYTDQKVDHINELLTMITDIDGGVIGVI